MVVVYKLSAFSYFIASRLVKIKHISLPNIIANKNLPSQQSSATFTNPWANTTIKKLSRRKKKAHSKARRSNSEQDWPKYKRLKSLS
jgi:lipid A disaccharide synthetase